MQMLQNVWREESGEQKGRVTSRKILRDKYQNIKFHLQRLRSVLNLKVGTKNWKAWPHKDLQVNVSLCIGLIAKTWCSRSLSVGLIAHAFHITVRSDAKKQPPGFVHNQCTPWKTKSLNPMPDYAQSWKILKFTSWSVLNSGFESVYLIKL